MMCILLPLMAKDKVMCVIGFNETLQNEGFEELMGIVKRGNEITCMGNDQYLVEKSVCQIIKTKHNILEEITN